MPFYIGLWSKELDLALFGSRMATLSLGVLGGLGAMLSITGIFGMNTNGLPFTELGTAFLWASAPMLLPSFAAWPIVRRIGILR